MVLNPITSKSLGNIFFCNDDDYVGDSKQQESIKIKS